MKHIQLHPFIIHRFDYTPLCLSKLSLHDVKEIWNWAATYKLEKIFTEMLIEQ